MAEVVVPCVLRVGLARVVDTTLSRNVKDGFLRQTKHFVGLFSVLIGSIAWLKILDSWVLVTGGLSSFNGRPRWERREASPSSIPQYAIMAFIAAILRRFSIR
jgi:hypothetical protein